MDKDVLASLRASTPRRYLGVAMLLILGVMLIYTALAQPPAVIGWQVFLIVVGAASLYAAERMRQATMLAIELTEDGLRSSDGEVIASMDQIASVDRSIFVFKPSNGFVVKLKSRTTRRWQPGLWWRMGARVGIGGVTPGAQGKNMADMLMAMVMERDGK